MSDFFDMPVPQAFWFVDSELLACVLRAEIQAVNHLTASEPALRRLLDTPNATESQRKLCFTVLAHRKVLEVIYDKFKGLCETPPDLDEEESKALDSIDGLIRADAPDWVLEMERVAEQLPSYIFSALPQLLQAGAFTHHDAAMMEAIQSAADAFCSMEQLGTLIERVLGQQWERLSKRWTVPAIVPPSSKKRPIPRKRDKLQLMRDKLIAGIAEVTTTPAEYLRLMDERKVKPQPTWSSWPGSWKEAYRQARLRKLIQQDKSRVLARFSCKK